MEDVAVLAVMVVIVTSVQGRIASWPLTPPMLFVGAGLLLGPHALDILRADVGDETLVHVTQLTLALLLFSDASRIDPVALREGASLPTRLLGIGLPLTIAAGTVAAHFLLGGLDWANALLVGAVLAPTDAALGQAVVSDPRVPVRIRQALNVESGVNDGLVVPVVTVALALVVGSELEGPGVVIGEALLEIILGVGVGVAGGMILGRLISWLSIHKWANDDALRIVTLGAGLAIWALAEQAGGNGFIAAFVAGATTRSVRRRDISKRFELTEDVGSVGASVIFMWFGALLVWPALDALSWPVVWCALAMLTVVRMVPVAISLRGTGLRPPSVAFIGWFGPRGLASVLFGMLIIVEYDPDDASLFHVVTLVVLASVLLHGMSAAPGARLYGQWYASHTEPELAEAENSAASPLRGGRYIDGPTASADGPAIG